MSFTVLGGNVSPFVRKVRVFLAEKGLDYEIEQINPFAPPEGWREVSPLGKIPAFRHGELVINDSSVICQYLERIHPEPALYPSDPFELARALWFEEYMDGGFVPVAGPGVFFPLVLKPLMTRQEPDETGPREVIETKLPAFFDYLEGQLDDADFLVGGRLSIADLAVASPFVNLRHAGVAPERGRWPRLADFLKRMHARPSFKACIEEETPLYGRRAALLED
jgi:glutathione S-transferase